jgi:hypothetical protein
MMVISYLLGQRYFPVPYALKKLLAYLAVMFILFAEKGVMYFTDNVIVRLLSGTVLMGLFLLLVLNAEKKELKGMPFVGKWIK